MVKTIHLLTIPMTHLDKEHLPHLDGVYLFIYDNVCCEQWRHG